MTAKQADRIAARIRRRLSRPLPIRGRYRFSITPGDLQALLELAESYAAEYRAQRKRDALLGPGDAMRLLRCGIRRLHSLIASGQLPCTRRSSGQRRFKRGDVEALVARENS